MLLKPDSVTAILQKRPEPLLRTESVADSATVIYSKGRRSLKLKKDPPQNPS